MLGRRKSKRAEGERLAKLPAARSTLDYELGLRPSDRAAVCFKLPAGDFVRNENEVQEALDAVARDLGSRTSRRDDEFGFTWILVVDRGLDELVAAVRLLGSQLKQRGFAPAAALFRFDGGERPVYLVYGYERGSFWPFVPTGEDKGRDNERELELKAKLERELPIEPDLGRWLALFDAPL